MADRQLSTRDKRVQTHVNFEYPDEGAAESPEDLASRHDRNLSEWKRARAFAERTGNAQGLKLLDDERARGAGIDFPHDNSLDAAPEPEAEDDLGFVAKAETGGTDDLGFVPSDVSFTPRTASQADVRKAEPQPLGAMAQQSADEDAFNAAFNAWLKTQRGQAAPAADARGIFTKLTGRTDPLANRDRAKVQHAADTGEIVYEDGPGYNVGKPAAGLAGFALGGPAGATAAEMAVRYGTLTSNLDRAVKAGAIDESRASEILAREMLAGTGVDAAFNFGIPVAGLLIKKIPGASWLGDKLKSSLEKLIGRALPSTPAPSLRDAKIEARAKLTDDPNRQTAVRELGKHLPEDFVPSPGQVRGQVGGVEGTVSRAFPNEFQAQEEAMRGATEGMRREAAYPASQPSAKDLGTRITSIAEGYERAVKNRLRPVFDEADNLGVAINLSPTVDIARKALAADKAVLGGNLTSTEREHLKAIVKDATRMRTNGLVTPDAALDFMSVQKAKLRTLNADGQPSTAFEGVIGKLTKSADDAYSTAARSANRGDIVQKLEAARKDYRSMMETVYDGSVQKSLKSNPEDVGRQLWQSGNQTEIEQVHKLLANATAEKTVSKAVADKTKEDLTRGFLQEAVPNVESAAKWSKSLAEDPKRARTWAALTAGPEGQALRDTMSVLENAAQMSIARDSSKVGKLPGQIMIGRAAQGGLGISLVTGTVHAPLMAVGLSVASVMNMMATAAVRGDKGTLNLITKVLRLRDASTGGSVQALRAAAGELSDKAKDYGIEVFEPAMPQEKE